MQIITCTLADQPQNDAQASLTVMMVAARILHDDGENWFSCLR